MDLQLSELVIIPRDLYDRHIIFDQHKLKSSRVHARFIHRVIEEQHYQEKKLVGEIGQRYGPGSFLPHIGPVRWE